MTQLFEGTSENSGDLHGQGTGSIQILKGTQKTLIYGVNNTDEGGDWVFVSLICTMSSVGKSML
jgi:hypothetical protein